MLIDDGTQFTNQLFQCFTAVDRRQYEYAELLIWIVLGHLHSEREKLENLLEFHVETGTTSHSIHSSALACIKQRETIINHVMDDLDDHRPW